MLRDEAIQATLIRDGYAVVGTIDERSIGQLIQYHQEKGSDDNNFYYSLLGNSYEENKQILDEQKKILAPFFKAHFISCRTITESYLIKPAQTESEFLLHQDWCYTDENKYQAYNVWIPLTDVNEQNGALFFLPGSHLWFENKRSGSLMTGRISSKNEKIGSGIVTIPMKQGEVIIFHPAVLHGSHPNLTKHARPVVTATIMDADAPFLYYHKINDQGIEVFQLEDEYFIKNLHPLTRGERPDAMLYETVNYEHITVTEQMIEQKLAEKTGHLSTQKIKV